MITKEKALAIVEKALNKSTAQQTEAVLINDMLWLTRFAESSITQNIAQEESRLIISVVNDKKIGLASTTDLSDDAIARVIEAAATAGSFQQPDEGFVSFPTLQIAPPLDDAIMSGTDVEFGPSDMGKTVAVIANMTNEAGLGASGAFRREVQEVALGNSLGVRQYGRYGTGELSLTVSGEGEQSGFAIGYNPDPSQIDYRAIAMTAIDKAQRNINPVVLDEGQYTVILEPAAVGQMLLFLGFMGFGGKTVMQRRSFLKRGEQIAGVNITITDEPLNPLFGYLPFDYEGIKRQPLTIIDKGIAGEAAFDSYYAALMGAQPTGHALPPDNTYGPYPKTLAMAPGQYSVDEMIASTQRGVLITHFWYINFLNPMQTMITGTTFDGTFLIENGAVTSPIKNMRTNQSILEAFSNVEMISKSRVVYPQYSSLLLVPALKINNFNLVQETEEEWEGRC